MRLLGVIGALASLGAGFGCGVLYAVLEDKHPRIALALMPTSILALSATYLGSIYLAVR